MEFTAEYIQKMYKDDDSISYIGKDYANGLCGGGIQLAHIFVDGYKAGSEEVSKKLEEIVDEALHGNPSTIDSLQNKENKCEQSYADLHPIRFNHLSLFSTGYKFALLNHKKHLEGLVESTKDKEVLKNLMSDWIAKKANTDITPENIQSLRESTFLSEESLKDISEAKFHGYNILVEDFFVMETLVMLQNLCESKAHPLRPFLQIYQKVFDHHYATLKDVITLSLLYPKAGILKFFRKRYDYYVQTRGLDIETVCNKIQGANDELNEGDFECLIHNACRTVYGEEQYEKLWEKRRNHKKSK